MPRVRTTHSIRSSDPRALRELGEGLETAEARRLHRLLHRPLARDLAGDRAVPVRPVRPLAGHVGEPARDPHGDVGPESLPGSGRVIPSSASRASALMILLRFVCDRFAPFLEPPNRANRARDGGRRHHAAARVPARTGRRPERPGSAAHCPSGPTPRGSAALELRGALLDEGAGGLLVVLGEAGAGMAPRLEVQAFGERAALRPR